MKTRFVFIYCIMLLCSAVCLSQVKTQPNSSARFEVIKSPKINSWVFRLDRFTGKIYQLNTPEKNTRSSWAEMKIEDLPKAISTKPIFQIYISENDVRETLLLNTENGQTWTLANTENGLMWVKFE